MAGNTGQDVNARIRVNMQIDFAGPKRAGRTAGSERKWRAAKLHRINAEQQVMHDRIADKSRFNDLGDANADFVRYLESKIVNRFAHRPGHFEFAARIHHQIRNPAH